MSDEVFHSVAYRAKARDHLLLGVDEYLDAVTVLPPGEWDPKIRIEPPNSVPSQVELPPRPRKQLPAHSNSGGRFRSLVKIRINHKTSKAIQLWRSYVSSNRKDWCEPVVSSVASSTTSNAKRLGKNSNRWNTFILIDSLAIRCRYKSDFTDAFHIQSVASITFLYFASLSPIITFGGLLGDATENRLAAVESLCAGCICGLIYSLFSGQPLALLNATGPVLVFEGIVYSFCK